MLILLPPSEGKTAPDGAGPLEPDTLSLPALAPARRRVLTALQALCRQPDSEAAREVLGLSPGQAGEVARNARLDEAPAAPAAQVYSGVLYDALGLRTLPAPAVALARRTLLIFSGLWGVLRTEDRIPAYRCSIGTRLPGIGALTGHWRTALRPVLPSLAGSGLLLDLRSAAYAGMWAPTGELAERTATVRVLHERTEHGVLRRTVVSHFNKATKGRLVRTLLSTDSVPESPAELAVALRDLGYRVETQPERSGGPRRLDIVVSAL